VVVDGIELSDQWEDVFATPPINDYDVILRLNQKWLRPEVGTIKKKHTTKYGHGLTIRKEDQYVVFFFLSLSLSFPSSSPHASHRLTLSLLSLLSLSSLTLSLQVCEFIYQQPDGYSLVWFSSSLLLHCTSSQDVWTRVLVFY
jgi:hypothetical protein